MGTTNPVVVTSALPPSSLHAAVLHERSRHGILTATNQTVLIIVAIVLITILAASILVLMVLRRSKSCRNDVEDGNGVITCKGSDINKKHLNKSAAYASARNTMSSPDVRNCISGGKLGFSSQAKYKGAQVFTYKELEAATDGFCEKNVVGHGGFGVVYRGTLGDGTVAAIKMLNREGKQGEREFRIEVDLLSQLHSSCLVRLLGYCADQHHRLLVFEFMPNGSLQSHLHPASRDHQHKPLDWGTRLKIALDCARALEFSKGLHKKMRASKTLTATV